MRRGEVWLINLDPTVGAEMRKTRSAVIVSSDLVGVLPMRAIVPLTTWQERYAPAPWMVRLEPTAENGLDQPSAADTLQVRCVAQPRCVRRLGSLAPTEMDAIAAALGLVLELER